MMVANKFEINLRHEAKEVGTFAYRGEAGSKVGIESSSCTLANSCKSLFYRMNSLAVLQSNMTVGSTINGKILTSPNIK